MNRKFDPSDHVHSKATLKLLEKFKEEQDLRKKKAHEKKAVYSHIVVSTSPRKIAAQESYNEYSIEGRVEK